MVSSLFFKTYCTCQEWKEADSKERSILLKQYPNQCPYCHQPVKSESKIDEVRIEVTLTGDNPFYSREITIPELKRLLQEV